jgi:hypothetical protein
MKTKPDYINRTTILTHGAFLEYLEDPDSPLGVMLQSALSTAVSRDVEDLVLSVLADPAAEGGLAAIELLKSLPSLSREMRDLLVSILDHDTGSSTDLVISALDALQRRGPTEIGEGATVANALLPLSESADESVRAHSLRVLGQWAMNDEGVQQTLAKAALEDKVVAVRVSAIEAFTRSTNLTSESIDTLLTLANDDGELSLLRKKAWRVLEEYPMHPDSVNSYIDFMNAQRDQERADKETAMNDMEFVSFEGKASFWCGPNETSLCQ